MPCINEKSLFNREQLVINSLKTRINDLNVSIIKDPEKIVLCTDRIRNIALDIIEARKNSAEVVFMMGGHVIRSGVQKYIIDLLEKGYIS
jgi:hypothetical protein